MKVLFFNIIIQLKNLINLFGENYEQMKAEVFKLLKIKYALIVVNENPLDLKMIEY